MGTECPSLPAGWRKEEVTRKSGLSAGKTDVYYYSPSGKKFRSRPQLSRYLGNRVDLRCFDFRSGKMAPAGKHKTRQRPHETLARGGRGDLNTSLPIRQTASIFKQPVTKVIGHPGNKVKSDLQREAEPPRQLFWEKRLKGLRSLDVTEEVLKCMELPKGLQSLSPHSVGEGDEVLLAAIAAALHSSSSPVTGQAASSGVEKNPGVWISTSQPPCRAFTITQEHIREQEEVVFRTRRRLEEALLADGLACRDPHLS
ncbi:methyl-CpG-binding domain protein 2 [Gadus morhua]|uniref:Methyl-CpG-binding domain protein 2-like n=1 Tax=Gadus morhua TaxID=8049 RepID=A0A8C4YW78_GADMO|nr:methyl-CpG-binding domain protein 2-like [Gadus morhua]XP_056434864.1 methyl-CpG-binding domain protein 2-like [Gadus chalcogrammus]